jgi:hypothetical protein
MKKFRAFMDSKPIHYVMAGLMIVFGIAFAILNWIIAFQLHHDDTLVNLPFMVEKIALVIGVILWVFITYSSWQDYQSRELSRSAFRTILATAIALSAGMIWKIPVLSLFGFGSAGLLCAAVAVGGGFLIRITLKNEAIKIS